MKNMKRLSIQLSILVMAFSVLQAQEVKWKGPSAEMNAGKLKVSENKRYLQYENGSPFFYLGCTAWELFHRLNLAEAEVYLENRREKGFTVIQAVALAELDGVNEPNANGDKPFVNNDLSKPDKNYWAHVDAVIKLAASKGLFIGLLPTWGDKVDKQWGVGPVLFDVKTAAEYGKWIGNRYKDYPNIIWINGGDRNCGGGNTDIWNSLAEGIKSVDKNHLMTFHPWGGTSSSACFQDAWWLDFNMLQSGHGERYISNHLMIQSDYQRIPVKPCMDGEPCYEDHAIKWNPENGWFDEWDVRRAAYLAVFAGAHGHTYGAHPIWQMKKPAYQAITGARHNWDEVLDLPGAWDMIHLRRLMLSRPYFSRIPDNSLVKSEQGGMNNPVIACRGDGYAFIYLPANRGAEIDLNVMGAETINAWWYCPRTGKSTRIMAVESKGNRYFNVPVPGIDWVLVLDDAAKEFSAPGNIGKN